jgi:hypothetical protein
MPHCSWFDLLTRILVLQLTNRRSWFDLLTPNLVLQLTNHSIQPDLVVVLVKKLILMQAEISIWP